jgi:hypothetical protein
MKLVTLNYLKAFAITSAIVGGSATAQVPVAHWTFDDGINDYDILTATDFASGNNGTWQRADTLGKSYVPGIVGSAISMRGAANDFFLVSSIPQINGIAPTPFPPDVPTLGVGVTWMGWFQIGPQAPTGSTYRGIMMTRTASDDTSTGLGSNQNYGLAWQDSGGTQGDHVDTRISGGAVDSPDMSIEPGVWYHAAMVWGNVGNLDEITGEQLPSQRVYLNGMRVAENLNTGVFEITTSGSWALGTDTFGGREWPGLLDDLAIFDSALSDAEVLQIYNNGLMGIDAAGNTVEQILAGDVDGLGGVTIADFNIIRENLGATVNARNLGDLDGNRRVDLNDFQQWLDAAPAALQAQALGIMSGAVPEPSAILLLGLALIGGGMWVRRYARPQ